jgi:predicted ATPase
MPPFSTNRLQYALVIGAYTHTEVDNKHPLTTALDEIKKDDGIVQELRLLPLSEEEIITLIEDSFNKNPSMSFPFFPSNANFFSP